MCLAIHKTCECGANTVQFHMRDNLLNQGVIARIFCPSCPGDAGFDEHSMVNDNGWVIDYDMELARNLLAFKKMMDLETVTPEYLFDQGYACWLEMYPGEKEDIREEREKIIAIMKEDQQRYLTEIQSWNINRINALKRAGWRKAQRA